MASSAVPRGEAANAGGMARGVRVSVLGDGSMGITLAHVVASGGRPCALWVRDPETARAINRDHRHPVRAQYELSPSLRATASLEEAVASASLVVVAVPSTRFRETAEELGAFAGPEHVLLSATKGIELPTLRCMSSILRETAPSSATGAITGPNITPEIMEGRFTAVLVASPSAEARERSVRALETPRLRVEVAGDLPSVELASVLKNVVAISIGVAAGRQLGFNALGLVFARGLAEIEGLGVRLGLDGGAFRGISGAGDLFLTASSPQSLNRRLGIELGEGKELDEVLRGMPEVPEGIGAVRACRMLARKHGISLPLAEVTARILEGEDGAHALERVLMEEPTGASE